MMHFLTRTTLVLSVLTVVVAVASALPHPIGSLWASAAIPLVVGTATLVAFRRELLRPSPVVRQ